MSVHKRYQIRQISFRQRAADYIFILTENQRLWTTLQVFQYNKSKTPGHHARGFIWRYCANCPEMILYQLNTNIALTSCSDTRESNASCQSSIIPVHVIMLSKSA